MEISFEFRFDDGLNEHKKELAKHRDLVTKATKRMLDSLPLTIGLIEIYPVARAGKSGSEVFYMDIFAEGIEYPRRFIAKFQDIKRTEKEYFAAHQAKFAGLCSTIEKEVDENNELGLIIYDLAKLDQHIEFRRYFLNLDNDDNLCEVALDSALSRVGTLSNNQTNKPKFLEDFKDYIERSRRPVERLVSYSNTNGKYAHLAELSKSVLEHFEKISLKVKDTEVIPYLVHGDLHARNLMLSAERPCHTELIDFDWVHYGHPAKDFCLMEATLKYMLLYELQLVFRKQEEEIHLPLKAFEKMETFLCETVFDLPAVEDFISYIKEGCSLTKINERVLVRVYRCLKVVRHEAKRVLSDYISKANENGQNKAAEKHYLISNFLITLGLSAFDEAEQLWTLTGLDIIGHTICQNHH